MQEIEKDNIEKDETSPLDRSRLEWFDKKRLVKEKALLVGTYKGKENEKVAQDYIQELKLLCETYGILQIESVCLSMRTYTAATYLSKGKLSDVKAAVDKFGIT